MDILNNDTLTSGACLAVTSRHARIIKAFRGTGGG
jgi:hypothetical protein